jgi:protein arginine kinase
LRRAHGFRLDRLEPMDRHLLHERHLVSRELASLDPSGAVRSGARTVGAGPGQRDVERRGSSPAPACIPGSRWRRHTTKGTGWTVNWGNDFPSLFIRSLGITTCPTNVGTGLRPRCSSTCRAWC